MAEWCERDGVEIWAYCLMPNHVHLIAVPESEESLTRAIGEAHTVPAARYIELNPVRVGLAKRAVDHRWSSAGAHVAGRDDTLVRVQPLVEMVGEGRWEQFLGEQVTREKWQLLRRHERTGRPLGDDSFLGRVESSLGCVLRPQKRGPKGPWKHRRKN